MFFVHWLEAPWAGQMVLFRVRRASRGPELMLCEANGQWDECKRGTSLPRDLMQERLHPRKARDAWDLPDK